MSVFLVRNAPVLFRVLAAAAFAIAASACGANVKPSLDASNGSGPSVSRGSMLENLPLSQLRRRRHQAGPDGAYPYSTVIAVNGVLYGTTSEGGPCDCGTVFGVTPLGMETLVYPFQGGMDGVSPLAGLINVGSKMYGTTLAGGTPGLGTVFVIKPSGIEIVLHQFQGGLDGGDPYAGLTYLQGQLYGTVEAAGQPPQVFCNGSNLGCGTVFQVTLPNGIESPLWPFHGIPSDGSAAQAGLIHASGVLYGTTYLGGIKNLGSIFSVTTGGNEMMLHSFTYSDGVNPSGALTEFGGKFYGLTTAGGAFGGGTIYEFIPPNTFFVLHNFAGGVADGFDGYAGLTQVGSSLYGTTTQGGAHAHGVFFRLTNGVETVLYSFGNNGTSDGATPAASLTNIGGILYGTTLYGGTHGYGTVFSMTTSGNEQVIYNFQG